MEAQTSRTRLLFSLRKVLQVSSCLTALFGSRLESSEIHKAFFCNIRPRSRLMNEYDPVRLAKTRGKYLKYWKDLRSPTVYC